METKRSMRYEIRQATPADVAELIRMNVALQESMNEIRRNLLRLGATSRARLREYYFASMHNDQTRLVIAQTVEPSRAVGMGTGKIWLHVDHLPPRSGELIDLWVDPEYRRQNLARRIITDLLQFFKTNGVEFLVVSYIDGNAMGELLWKKLGFQPALVTATVDRVKAEASLGIRSRHIMPLAYRSVLADTRGAYTHPAMSG